MSKLFAITVIVIAIASAVPIVMHTWGPPEDISTHGHMIDKQMDETMIEAGLSFLAAQFILALFIWQYGGRGKQDKGKALPGAARGLAIAALALVGAEILALGVAGHYAWATGY